ADPGALIHLSPEKGREFFEMLDPTLPALMARVMLEDSEIMDEQLQVAGQMFGTFLEHYKDIGKRPMKPGQGIGDALKSMNRETGRMLSETAAPSVALDALRAEARHDAFALALSTETSAPDVRRVIAGMRQYVEHRSRRAGQ
ncbi:MAG: hypothetical protein AAGG01_22710, partial [Planctomycetota bacterium]